VLHLGAPLVAEIKSQLLLRLDALGHRKAVAVLVVVRFVFHCGSVHYRRKRPRVAQALANAADAGVVAPPECQQQLAERSRGFSGRGGRKVKAQQKKAA
jgi:hypothetical protein